MVTGRDAAPVSAEAVTVPPAPTLAVATANTPLPVTPGTFTMPSLFSVAARAMMSGTGVAEADNRSVLIPGRLTAGAAFAQSKTMGTSAGAIGAVGVKANTKLCVPAAGMSTGVFTVPVTWLVTGSVVWKANVAATLVPGARLHPVAIPDPALMMVANAVAAAPTRTERLLGSTAATSVTELVGRKLPTQVPHVFDVTAYSANIQKLPSVGSTAIAE